MAIETGSSAFAGYKLGGMAVAFAAPFLGFVLGLQVLPLSKADPHRDVVRRLLGCAVSSMTIGPCILVAIYKLAPWVFDAVWDVGAMFGGGPLGLIWLAGIVLLLSALPGWWLVGALVREVASWDGKTIAEIAQDIRSDAEQVMGGKDA